MGLKSGFIQPRNPSVERDELVDGFREFAGDVRQQGFVVVIQTQVLASHGHARPELGTEIELLAADAQLAHQLDQRRTLRAFRHPVGQRVQADVVLPLTTGVEGIEPARGVVPLEHQDLATEHSQADRGGEARHTSTDDDGVVMGGGAGHGAKVAEVADRSSDALRAS